MNMPYDPRVWHIATALTVVIIVRFIFRQMKETNSFAGFFELIFTILFLLALWVIALTVMLWTGW